MITLTSLESADSSRNLPKRLVTLDILRGIAIFGMILVHVSYKLFDATWLMDSINAGNFDFNPFVWILVIILGYFGNWHGFFLFISAIVNSLVFARKVKAGYDARRLLGKNLIGGIIIVAIGYLVEGFGYWGYFGNSIRTGDWTNFRPFVAESFWIQTLQIIGLAIMINGVIQYLILRKKGYEKTTRNVIIYGLLIGFVLLATPFINDFIASTYIPNWPDIYAVSGHMNGKTWLLNIIAGPKFPLMPFMVSAFFGSLIGIFLADPRPKKKVLRNFSIVGAVLILVGGVLVVLGFVVQDLPSKYQLSMFTRPILDVQSSNGSILGLTNLYQIFKFTTIENPPGIGFYMVRLGGQILLLMLLFSQIEFKGKGEKFANKFVWKFFRRWGTFSLTIYSLHILELLPRGILTLVTQKTTGVSLLDHYVIPKEYFWLIIFIVIYVLMFYELVVMILIRFNMKGSVEWFFVKLQSLFSKVKSNKLQSGVISEDVIWANYEETQTGSDD